MLALYNRVLDSDITWQIYWAVMIAYVVYMLIIMAVLLMILVFAVISAPFAPEQRIADSCAEYSTNVAGGCYN